LQHFTKFWFFDIGLLCYGFAIYMLIKWGKYLALGNSKPYKTTEAESMLPNGTPVPCKTHSILSSRISQTLFISGRWRSDITFFNNKPLSAVTSINRAQQIPQRYRRVFLRLEWAVPARVPRKEAEQYKWRWNGSYAECNDASERVSGIYRSSGWSHRGPSGMRLVSAQFETPRYSYCNTVMHRPFCLNACCGCEGCCATQNQWLERNIA